jgi:ketosteroid isomerase-like protein
MSRKDAVASVLQRINRAWLERRPDDLRAYFHPSMTMVLPGFSGQIQGLEPIIAGFVDFCEHATVHDYRETDHQVDVIGDTAVASFAWEMVYERAGQRYRATGRDLWVFARQGDDWLAVWRTMLDLAEQPVPDVP